jgi:hypothetical protein
MGMVETVCLYSLSDNTTFQTCLSSTSFPTIDAVYHLALSSLGVNFK